MSRAPTTLSSSNLPFVEQMYAEYLRNPSAVAADWRAYFESAGDGGRGDAVPPAPSFRPPSLFHARGDGRPAGASAADPAALQDRVDQLLRAYRVRGHMVARLDPLELPRAPQPELDPGHYGFGAEHMELVFSCRTLSGATRRPLREIIECLRNTYCRSIGVQFMHIDDLATRHWLQERMEGTENRLKLSRTEQFRILKLLTDAVVFEEFIQRKYVGAKSFSLEGCESLIPLLALAIDKAGEQGVREIVLGMAHRGRLNVLANILGKPAREIFREFEDTDPALQHGSGDVKYHLGYSSDWETSGGKRVHLSLCFNPSHLEFINPVVLGRTRAKQDRHGDAERRAGLALLIHGDAAFSGQGVVQETLNLSELPGYRVGGAIHIIVNNQIGFTTSPGAGRSSIYASGVAKMLQIPIFHVNGEDPEAVAQVIRLALDFRAEFRRDAVIDMWGYRRHGHNEGDEPSFTQPQLYSAIRARKSVREGYLEHLVKLGGVTVEQGESLATFCRESLEQGLAAAREGDFEAGLRSGEGVWRGYVGGPDEAKHDVATGVEQGRLGALLRRMTELPEGFHLHAKLRRFVESRREMAEGKRAIDWSAAEALALASLATEGVRVRLSGQDSERGTFSQRHAVLHDMRDGRTYMPLAHLAEEQAPVEIINSPLSEVGVMGFEYGYSLDCPEGLVLWEAQFGDFFNAAQVIVDQFLASAEHKWQRLSGLVLLLPHGFEGQGPEHSSARLERFLLLAAQDNIQVVSPSTAAQYFHCLRRQALRQWRKPLVVMTPKSLLRHARVASGLEELAGGAFRPVIGDEAVEAKRVRRILLCCGKLSVELMQQRAAKGREDVAIVRLEQLYPLREEALRVALEPYAEGVPVYWVQEAPHNMGAWRYLRVRLGERVFGRALQGITRPEAASPGTGSPSRHEREQAELIERALGDEADGG